MGLGKTVVSGPVAGNDEYLAYVAEKTLPISNTAGVHDMKLMLVQPVFAEDVPDNPPINVGQIVRLRYNFAQGSRVDVVR